METSSDCSIANRSASTERPPAPFFRLGSSAPFTRILDCFKKCLATGLRTAFDGGDAFSVLEVRPPLVLSVSAPDPTINHTAWKATRSFLAALSIRLVIRGAGDFNVLFIATHLALSLDLCGSGEDARELRALALRRFQIIEAIDFIKTVHSRRSTPLH